MTANSLLPRRTQEQRSASMRVRLLDATIDCLVAYGYAGTTVSRVADQAGVTRGAQGHHYPTKADLVAAAIAHLADKLTQQVLADLQNSAPSADPVGDLLDRLWETHRGPVFAATVELWVAARTDPELRSQVSAEPFVESASGAFQAQLHRSQGTTRELLPAIYTSMDAIRGLLLSSWGLPEARLDARWRRARPLLLQLFDAAPSSP
jgi:AcrR family transcriptional regulator